jgi:hypothetical protein
VAIFIDRGAPLWNTIPPPTTADSAIEAADARVAFRADQPCQTIILNRVPLLDSPSRLP